jgi:ribosomal-protein-alanine N-acetyltransferase
MSFVARLLDRGVPDEPERGRAVAIEPMRRRHLRSVLAIEQQVYPRPWTLATFQTELTEARAGRRYYCVARRDGAVVGYGGLMFVPDEAHVTNVAVDPSQQRGGIGTRLLLDLTRAALDARCHALSLEVRVSNHAAQEMYRRFGFAPAGIRPKYYENVEDAIIMWAHDIDSPQYRARLRSLEEGL